MTHLPIAGVKVWNADTGVLAAGPFPGTIGDGYTVAPFSPDSRRIVISDEVNVVIYDLVTGQRIADPLVHRLGARAPTFSPDGRLLATAASPNVQLWDANTTRPVGPPMIHRGVFRGIQFSRDGRRLLTWTRSEIRVWDVASSTAVIEPIHAGNDVQVAAFSEDEAMIVTQSTAQRETRIWDSTTGQMLVGPITGASSNAFYPPSFHRGGRLLAIGAGGVLQVWPVPADSRSHQVPDWLLRLARAHATGEIDRFGSFREQPFESKKGSNRQDR